MTTTGFIANTWCAALLDTSLPCGTRLEKRETTPDSHGHYWCALHQWRGKLLDWAKSYQYVELRAGPYWMGPGRDVWELQVLMGKEAMIQAVIRTLGLDGTARG